MSGRSYTVVEYYPGEKKNMKEKENKTVPKAIRFPPKEAEEIMVEAELNGRTFSQHVRYLVALARKAKLS